MSRLSLLFWILLDLVGGLALVGALARSHALELAPLPVRGTSLVDSGRPASPREEPVRPLWDARGRLDLAALTLPDYDPPELRSDPTPLERADFPPEVAALHGQVLTARGYPLAVSGDARGTRRILLSRNPPGCCFGARPVLDEWIEVELEEPLRDLDPRQPTDFRGRLEVGELSSEDGYASSLYRMPSARRVDTDARGSR